MLTSLAYRSLALPAHAPFELKPSPGKGWGVFATRPIEQGTVIFTEKPLFVIPESPDRVTREDVSAAFQKLSARGKKQFRLIRDNAVGPSAPMLKVFHDSCFAIDEPDGYYFKNSSGFSILRSLLNHSCVPNSKIDPSEKKVEAFAVKDIKAGEEITLCYNQNDIFLKRHERLQTLGFACSCKACLIVDPLEQQLSDMRRTLIRGLYSLILGIDLNSRQQNTKSLIIPDRNLRRAAEQFHIPLSKSFVHLLLMSTLLEQEGILEIAVHGQYNGMVMQIMCACFKTQSNAKVANLAMKQETWLERLRVAWKLYGKPDMGDCSFSLMMSTAFTGAARRTGVWPR